MDNSPNTLLQAIQYFSDEQVCIDTVAGMRWPDGVKCPHCDTPNPYYLKTQKRWKCRDCRVQFSVKVKSIFEDSPVSLTKWLPALWLLVNCKNGVSSWELHRALGVTQKTAWFMLQRLRLVLKGGGWEKMQGGPIEVDETFVGGELKNMHSEKKARYRKRGGTYGKAIVMGMLDRQTGKVRAKVVPNTKSKTLHGEIVSHVEPKSIVYTDSATGYDHLAKKDFIHETTNHMNEYVRGQVHTQGIENFWALLKRGIGGTYVSIEPFHLDRYIDEQIFRYNNRATKDNPLNDGDRFLLALSQVANKRLTYAELTGKLLRAEA
jgi:transposase-like protein